MMRFLSLLAVLFHAGMTRGQSAGSAPQTSGSSLLNQTLNHSYVYISTPKTWHEAEVTASRGALAARTSSVVTLSVGRLIA